MSVETGIELLDAIINNPMQSIILFMSIYVGYQFLFQCRGFFAELRHDVRFWLRCILERKLERILGELDTRLCEWDNNRKKLSPKQFMVVEYGIFGTFMGFIIHQLLTVDHVGFFYFNVGLIGCYSFIITRVTMQNYRRFKQHKNLTLQNSESVK